jgi:hypothetical protein
MVFNAPNALYGVGFGNDMFVAVGEEAVYTSDATGGSWTRAATVPANLNDVAFGAGKWLAAGNSVSEGDAVLYQSTDARTWTEVETSLPSAAGFTPFSSVAFGDDSWVASVPKQVDSSYESGLYTSRDGISWSPTNASGGGGSIGYADGVGWLVMGTGGTPSTGQTDGVAAAGVARRSADGTTWTDDATTPQNTSFSGSLIFVDGRWYAGAWNPGGLGLQGVVTSTDGINWSLAGDPSDTVVDLAYSGGSGATTSTETSAAGSPPCTNEAIQAALQNTADATSVAVHCNGSWAAVAGILYKDDTEGNALFRANGNQWELGGTCNDPSIPPDIFQVACTSS